MRTQHITPMMRNLGSLADAPYYVVTRSWAPDVSPTMYVTENLAEAVCAYRDQIAYHVHMLCGHVREYGADISGLRVGSIGESDLVDMADAVALGAREIVEVLNAHMSDAADRSIMLDGVNHALTEHAPHVADVSEHDGWLRSEDDNPMGWDAVGPSDCTIASEQVAR